MSTCTSENHLNAGCPVDIGGVMPKAAANSGVESAKSTNDEVNEYKNSAGPRSPDPDDEGIGV